MADSILIVGCGFPQLGLIRFCKAEGLTTVGLDLNPQAVGGALCDDLVVASTTDTEAIARAVQERQLTGLTTCGSEHALLPCAEAAERTGRPFYAEPDTVRGCQLKDAMRDSYAAAGAPSPRHRSVTSLEQAQAFVEESGLPVVVKPTRGWGQRGVRVVQRSEELEGAVAGALDSAGRALAAAGLAQAPSCLLEDFIPGREFSVDAYSRDGRFEVLAVTERIITGYPDPPGITFAEVHTPDVPGPVLVELEAGARLGAAALAIRRGPTYTQLRSGDRGTFIVETAYRLGGGLDPDVTFLASGVSLYRRIVGAALKRPEWESSGPEAPAHGGAVGRFLIGKPGRVTAVRGLEQARALPGIAGAEVYVQPGDTVHPLTDGSKRAGHVLAYGESRAAAESRAGQAMELIEIVTEAA